MRLNVNSINDFFTTQHTISINKLSQLLIKRDEEIYKLGEWRKEGWVPKEKRIRNIVDVHGELKYIKRIYRKWNTIENCWENKSFLDAELGIKKYQKLTLDLQLKILELAEGKRQKDIIHCFPWLNLSRMTISRIIRKYDIKYFSSWVCNKFKQVNLINKEYIYIFMDEGFVTLRDNKKTKKYRCRITTFNTGYDIENCKYNKNCLENKRGFVILKEEKTGEINTSDYIQRIFMELNLYYENFENKQFVVGGDGDSWIMEVANQLGAKYILDRFHLAKELKRAFVWKYAKENKWLHYNECYDFLLMENMINYLHIV